MQRIQTFSKHNNHIFIVLLQGVKIIKKINYSKTFQKKLIKYFKMTQKEAKPVSKVFFEAVSFFSTNIFIIYSQYRDFRLSE